MMLGRMRSGSTVASTSTANEKLIESPGATANPDGQLKIGASGPSVTTSSVGGVVPWMSPT